MSDPIEVWVDSWGDQRDMAEPPMSPEEATASERARWVAAIDAEIAVARSVGAFAVILALAAVRERVRSGE